MKRSESRILTTHTGSLPRSPEQQELLRAREEQRGVDPKVMEERVRQAVADIVKMQTDTGITVVNDGEQGRAQYATYVKDRLTGFDGERRISNWDRLDDKDFPEWAATRTPSATQTVPQAICSGPVAWKDFDAVQRDIDNLKAATASSNQEEVFMTSASPGVIATFLRNDYYPDHESYIRALAEVMKDEYKAIVDSGLILQIDCPDLAMTRPWQWSHLSTEEFLKVVELHIEVINHALDGLPPDRMRLHLCWGNVEGPHTYDVPIKDLLPIVLKARPMGLSFEGANPRHAHEYKVWKDVKLPDGKVIIPGVLDTVINFVEHPELVADRIVKYAEIVGRENVIASTDCGFGTSAWGRRVDSRVAWAKLQSMVDGARIASEELWS
jgi:5-methyltetrahydropteroyltriglutamate--homocysteine methyltransferase